MSDDLKAARTRLLAAADWWHGVYEQDNVDLRTILAALDAATERADGLLDKLEDARESADAWQKHTEKAERERDEAVKHRDLLRAECAASRKLRGMAPSDDGFIDAHDAYWDARNATDAAGAMGEVKP